MFTSFRPKNLFIKSLYISNASFVMSPLIKAVSNSVLSFIRLNSQILKGFLKEEKIRKLKNLKKNKNF